MPTLHLLSIGQEMENLKISVCINLLNIVQEKGQQREICVYITLADHWPGKGAAARGLCLHLFSIGQEKVQKLEVCVYTC